MQQPYSYQESQQPERSARQEFHRSNIAMGVAHVVKMAGTLSPLLILEFVKDPTRAHRWIRIAAVATAGLTEMCWATRARRSNPEERRR